MSERVSDHVSHRQESDGISELLWGASQKPRFGSRTSNRMGQTPASNKQQTGVQERLYRQEAGRAWQIPI